MPSLPNKKKRYSAFGLTILSDIEIPYFINGEGIEDASIIIGNVPESIDNAIYQTSQLQISEKEFLFLHSEADYYVKNGNTIIVNAHEAIDGILAKGFLTGIVMGALLFQRGLIPIHGSAISVAGKGVIFTGGSGTGKSTICASFRKHNYEFLSDDITVVEFDNDYLPVVLPSFPQQRLHRDTAKGLGYDIRKLSKADDKYIIEDCFNFSKRPVPLYSIYKIEPENRHNIEIHHVSGSDKLKALIENLYFSEIFMKAANPEYFMKLSKLVNIISWYSLNKPIRKYPLHRQMKKIISIMQAS